MVRFAAAFGLLLTLAGGLLWWTPFLTQERAVVTSTPSPGPVFSRLDVPLKRGGRVCVAPVAIDRGTAVVQLQVSTQHPARSQVVIDVTGPGYRESRPLVIATTRDPAPARATIVPPSHDIVGQACLRNRGRLPVSVYATNEGPSIGLAQTSVDGHALGQAQGVQLLLFESAPRSIVDRLGQIVHRASDFTGGLLPFWLTWLFVVVLVLGTPFAVFAGFWASLRDPAAQ